MPSPVLARPDSRPLRPPRRPRPSSRALGPAIHGMMSLDAPVRQLPDLARGERRRPSRPAAVTASSLAPHAPFPASRVRMGGRHARQVSRGCCSTGQSAARVKTKWYPQGCLGDASQAGCRSTARCNHSSVAGILLCHGHCMTYVWGRRQGHFTSARLAGRPSTPMSEMSVNVHLSAFFDPTARAEHHSLSGTGSSSAAAAASAFMKNAAAVVAR